MYHERPKIYFDETHTITIQLLTLFRQNSAFAAALLLLLALVLRIPVLINPKPYLYIQTAPVSQTLFNYLLTFSNYILLSYIIALVLLLVQAFFLNYIVAQHSILYKDTFLPGLFFVLINSFYPQQAELTPQLISNMFIILMFQRLCFLYESTNPLLIVLDAGMYLGLALLFNYDVAVFLPFILISVVVFTSFNIRYLALALIGILIPLYFAISLYYLNDQLNEIIAFTLQSLERSLLKSVVASYPVFFPVLIVLPIALIAAFQLQIHFFSNKVKTRRILQTVALLFFFGGLGLIVENSNFMYAVYYLSIPLSIVMAYYFISPKRWLLKELLLFACIGLSVYYHLFYPW